RRGTTPEAQVPADREDDDVWGETKPARRDLVAGAGCGRRVLIPAVSLVGHGRRLCTVPGGWLHPALRAARFPEGLSVRPGGVRRVGSRRVAWVPRRVRGRPRWRRDEPWTAPGATMRRARSSARQRA